MDVVRAVLGKPDRQQAVGALSHAFNEPERYGPAAEDRREKEREQRINGFRCGVGEKAHPPEHPDRRWKRAPQHAGAV